jgi:kinesin family member 6/9
VQWSTLRAACIQPSCLCKPTHFNTHTSAHADLSRFWILSHKHPKRPNQQPFPCKAAPRSMFADRGMIPRSISHIFKAMGKRSEFMYSLHVSYMELYNSSAYDLLDPSRDIKELTDLPAVTVMEDDSGRFHMRNLSLHRCAVLLHFSGFRNRILLGLIPNESNSYPVCTCQAANGAVVSTCCMVSNGPCCRAATEEEALNLLFLGDTNRMIAETPINMASSRSHCVFTLHMEARRAGEDIVRKSKLNLVDLAGSERVGKSGIDGVNLSEAKYINASLHFLEQVIMALQVRGAS